MKKLNKNIFSLRRLSQSLARGELSDRVTIAGRLTAVDEKSGLILEQGVRLEFCLPQGFSAQAQDHVSFSLQINDLKNTSNSKEISFFAAEVFEFQVLQKNSQTSHSLKNVDIHKFRSWLLFREKFCAILESRDLERVETPTLVVCPGTETHLQPFQTECKVGPLTQQVFLPTSPEIHLKKILCQNITDFYEVRACFRNEEQGSVHEPEFTMAEWYRAYAGLDFLVEDLKALVRELQKDFGAKDIRAEFVSLSVRELFSRHLGFQLTPKTTLQELQTWAEQLGSQEKFEQWQDAFHWIFVNNLEEKIPQQHWVILREFPPQLCAFAKIDEVSGWANRFELYHQGFEIANAYDELTDLEVNRERMLKDLAQRRELQRTEVPLDEEYFAALRNGMPPAAGIALGMERFYMAITGQKKIADFKCFTWYEKSSTSC